MNNTARRATFHGDAHWELYNKLAKDPTMDISHAIQMIGFVNQPACAVAKKRAPALSNHCDYCPIDWNPGGKWHSCHEFENIEVLINTPKTPEEIELARQTALRIRDLPLRKDVYENGYVVPPRTLYIIRGLPGSGKTTLAHTIADDNVCEADDYFINMDGEYMYNPANVPVAHRCCHRKCERLMAQKEITVAVSNTFTRHIEYESYLELADKYDYRVIKIICTGNFKNVHNVPEEVIQRMRDRFEY